MAAAAKSGRSESSGMAHGGERNWRAAKWLMKYQSAWRRKAAWRQAGLNISQLMCRKASMAGQLMALSISSISS
jgi:hypothetical protein